MFEELDNWDFSFSPSTRDKCKNCRRATVLREHFGTRYLGGSTTEPILWARLMADHLEEDHCECKKEATNDNL